MCIEDKLMDINIAEPELLITPRELIEMLPADSATRKFVYEGREAVKKILDGKDKRILMKIGPCSIHDIREAREYFTRLKPIAEKVQDKILILCRTYFEKPRTRVDWPGLFYDPDMNGKGDIAKGAKLARTLLLETSKLRMLTTTEILSPEAVQFYGDLLSDASIGARTIESPSHRYLASGLSMPVGLKNGTCGSIDAALDAVITTRHSHVFLGPNLDLRGCIQRTKGNQYSYMILRGGKNKTNYDEESVRYAQEILKGAGIKTGIVIDASHANSVVELNGQKTKDTFRQPDIVYEIIKLRNKGLNIVGVMVESYLKDGADKVSYPLVGKHPSNGMSRTDSCIGLEKTEKMIMKVYKML